MNSLAIILEKVKEESISTEEASQIIKDLINTPVSVGTTLTNDHLWRGGYVYPTTAPNDYPYNNPIMYTNKTE